MSSYLYDDLLTPHFQKTAIWSFMARGAAKLAPTVAKGAFGYATGIPIGKAGTAGMVAGMAKDMLPSVNKSHNKPTYAGFGAGGAGATNGEQGGRNVMASLRENEASYRFKGAEGHGLGATLAHVSPYVAWIGSQLVRDSNPNLAKALSAGAYLGYAGSAAHDAITNPKERVTGAVDALALTAMLGSDVARWRR